MPIPRVNFVLSVRDLSAERAFYRDIVGLGDPVMDSNVWVEFALSGGASFCLEQAAPADASSLPPHGRIACLFQVDSAAAFEDCYRAHGFATGTSGSPCEHMGMNARVYADPEGNLFRVTDAALR